MKNTERDRDGKISVIHKHQAALNKTLSQPAVACKVWKRLIAKVTVGRDSDCWTWEATKNSGGYGQIWVSLSVSPLALSPSIRKQVLAVMYVNIVVIFIRAFRIGHCEYIKTIVARYDQGIQQIFSAIAVIVFLVPPDCEYIPDHMIALIGRTIKGSQG